MIIISKASSQTQTKHSNSDSFSFCALFSWRFEQPSPVLQTESQKLLLRLLSHPLLHVRMETYGHTLSLVKVSASHPPCTLYK